MHNELTPATGPQVLVVDADEAVRNALKRVLERAGCRVQVAGDPSAGAALLARTPMDLAVVDIDTFASESESLLEQLCKPEAQFPILVLSRSLEPAVRKQAAQVGGLLIKPVDGLLLLDTVAALLEKPRAYWRAARVEEGTDALRRLQASGAQFRRSNLPYRPLYH